LAVFVAPPRILAARRKQAQGDEEQEDEHDAIQRAES
jgi:hypothetical protein